ncbi:hypothetical protein OHU45_02565 [Streptomyces tubercidicus]|uniref:hypothetical protein n=1 Tax=Streptomyces tubercidicus TaxID=47759 RepID=UPI002E11E8F0|nr:hypothetical protein OG761_02390 [Streptomyces tubercidicus]WSX24501.1 hypothetical protein OG690_34950 [Streptomyces tubercidicus]
MRVPCRDRQLQSPAVVVTVPFVVGTPNGSGKVQVTFERGQVGENAVDGVVFAADGGVATVPEIRLHRQRARPQPTQHAACR